MFLEPQVCPAKADKSWYGDKLGEVKEGHESNLLFPNRGQRFWLFIRHIISTPPRADTDALLHDLRFGIRPKQRAKQEQWSSCRDLSLFLFEYEYS